MTRAREQEHEDLEVRFQLLSELTNLERNVLVGDIDRVYGRAICSTLKRRFQLNDEESLTIWSDSILAAVLKPEGFQPGKGSLRSWLSGVAHHLAVKYVTARAKRSREGTIEPDLLDQMAESRHDDAGSTDACTLEEALSPLSEADTRLLRARYIEGWSLCELAEAIGKSSTAVKSRIYRILRKLRRMWHETG